MNKSWRQHPTRHQLYGHLPPITKTIQVRRTRHAGHCWRSRDELIRDVLLWTPTHGRAKATRPERIYIQQLCEDTGCFPEDLPRAMNDREEWRERVRDIRATSATLWWWYIYIYIYIYIYSSVNNKKKQCSQQRIYQMMTLGSGIVSGLKRRYHFWETKPIALPCHSVWWSLPRHESLLVTWQGKPLNPPPSRRELEKSRCAGWHISGEHVGPLFFMFQTWEG